LISLNNNKWTDATAGYDSVVLGRSVPTAPVRVDAMAGVPWAQEVLVRNALAQLQPESDDDMDMLRANIFLASVCIAAYLWAKKNLGVVQIAFRDTMGDYRDVTQCLPNSA